MGNEIDAQKTERIVRPGISHVPEGRQIFASGLTVQQNLLLGAYVHGLKKVRPRALYPVHFRSLPRSENRDFPAKQGP